MDTYFFIGVNLCIKNLEDEIDEDFLRLQFSVYGAVLKVKVVKDEKGVSKGFGFICLSSPDEASKAIRKMNGKVLLTKPLHVSYAQRKEERRKQLFEKFMKRFDQLVFNAFRCMLFDI